jgi:hypothetical protein
MPFIAINGITFPVAIDGHSETPREIGEGTQAYGGGWQKTLYAATRNDIQLESIPLLDADALAWESLIRGYGERWGFTVTPPGSIETTTFYGSKATPPLTTTGVTFSGSAPLLLGSVRISIAANSPTRYFEIPDPASQRWTAAVWRSIGATALSHFVVTSSGRKWLNGVRADGTSTTWLVKTGSSLRIHGDLVAVTNVDDLVFLPFDIPLSWGPSFYQLATGNSLVYPPTPQLVVTGDIFGGVPRYYLGSVTSSRPLRAAGGTRRRLTVNLTEV